MTTPLLALAAIFRDNLLPLFLLMAAGFALQRRVGLDMKTLTRANLYVFVPALACYALSKAVLSAADLLRVFGFVVVLEVVMYGVARAWTALRGYPPGLAAAFALALMFYNSGNYGYPLIALLYGKDSAAVGLQAIVLATQNATLFSLGQVIMRHRAVGFRSALGEYFRMPFPYAVALGLLLQFKVVSLPGFALKTLESAAGGLVPVALMTLGAQLALVRWHHGVRSVVAATFARLVLGSVVAFGLLSAVGWRGPTAEMLLISSSVPTAVNTAILAVEHDSEPDFAAQVVFVTTLTSAATVGLTIFVARAVFGG
ncbi:MAG: AEC family transporter [Armatimonadetes bacterium]|nr:AEC family transporter [Armatimonadota bacterium]